MAQQNLQLVRGDTNVFDATITLSGAPLDVSAYDIWCTAKYSKDDADVDALFQITKAAGEITVGGASNNVATCAVPASDTVSLLVDVTVFYDIQIRAPGDQITTVANGTMLISRDITRTIV